MGSCSVLFFFGCFFNAILTVIKCAGRTKVESIENPEKTSNCIKQAGEVMAATIWWQEDLGKAEGTAPPL